jgi:hypothetical protein
MTIKLSIIIPMFNDFKGCLQTLDSLQNSIKHSGQNVQVIVVDSSLKHQWIPSHPDVLWIYVPHKIFAGHARNLGVRFCVCDWIGFLDCGLDVDIEWVNDMIASQSLNMDVVWGKSDFKTISTKQKAYIRSFHRISFSSRFIRSSMIRKDVFNKLNGFVTHVHAGEDLDFYQRLVASKANEVWIDAQAWYAHFPKNSKEIFLKWSYFTKDNVIINQAHRKFIFVSFQILLLSLLTWTILIGYSISIVFFFQIMMLRLYFQTKQSKLPLVSVDDLLLTIWYTFVFDLSRFAGLVWGLIEKVKKTYET